MACGVRGSLWPGWCCRSCRGWSRQPAVHSYVSMRSVHGQYMVSIQSAYSLHAVSTWSACSQLTACIWASHGQHAASIRPHTVRRSPAACSTQLCQHAACTRPVHGQHTVSLGPACGYHVVSMSTACIRASHGQHTASIRPHTVSMRSGCFHRTVSTKAHIRVCISSAHPAMLIHTWVHKSVLHTGARGLAAGSKGAT